MRKLVARWGLREPIMDLAASGAPILGTCAGMIVVAREIAGGEEPVFPLLDVTVERNAFGRQLDSFETDLPMPILGDRPVHAIFIRAPIIERVGPGVEVLASAARRPRRGGQAAQRHRHLVPPGAGRRDAGSTGSIATMAAEYAEPGEGTVARPARSRGRSGEAA